MKHQYNRIQSKERNGISFPGWITALLIAGLMVTGAITGCQSPPASDSGVPGEPLQAVTLVLDWVPNTNHTGFYSAAAMGYFAEEGLEVEIIQPTHGGSADLIAAGQGEFGISYQEQVTYARTAADPLPIKAIAAIIQHNTSGFASPASKGIEHPGDFEGKTYGGWGSPVEEAMLQALMTSDGGDFSQVEMMSIGTADFFDAVENHVDFTWIYYGWDGIAAELRDYDINFILLQDYVPALNFYTPALITSEKLIDEEPELVQAFVRASARGYQFAMQQPEEAAAHLLAAVPELDEAMVVASQQYLAQQYQADAPRWGEMKLSVWEDYAHWMFQQGLLENQLDASAAFTNAYLPEAGDIK
ncbi:ABC transporter substrate-binding protein [Anoxynatronum buryatiense]|uniref:ABC-type nitrate/sulfonate/bicarbonate transport system, substrate-binding protein n=1 Tax=Anoxynatronum buryatiense TaxID=489973 RepID=A0AA45WU33_9CLOT|nr:ABC transporter substrate-binding protein [Anoxynatronum buryatiense]SMP44640.1 ABC-type nitrate/sulfonate/bicarbonate transport system, substrate-binding protein [Anoxynatronum buryatiense]